MSAKKLRKGKMRYLLIALTFLLCFSVRLYAATWVQLDDDNFIDKDSIKRYANDRSELQLNKKIVWMKLLNTNNVYVPFEKDYKKKRYLPYSNMEKGCGCVLVFKTQIKEEKCPVNFW